MAGGILLDPWEGEVITDRPGRLLVVKAEHELLDVTKGRFGPGEAGAAPHIHREHADAFYVLDGELAFWLGPESERLLAPAGTLVLVPAGVIHSFANGGSGETHYLNLHAPSRSFVESLRARQHEGYEPARFDAFDPPADGGRPVSDAVVRGLGEGDAIAVGASGALFKAEGSEGDGTLCLLETTLAPGFPGPVLHRHEHLVDTFYVLDGTLTLHLGDHEVEAGTGAYAFVPPGVAHTFSNRSEGIVRFLNVMAPGGLEQYLREVAAATTPGEPPDPALMATTASRYDFRPV
jgi:mannose-6-phosphate isomerase-like protein (cupin superfamily)